MVLEITDEDYAEAKKFVETYTFGMTFKLAEKIAEERAKAAVIDSSPKKSEVQNVWQLYGNKYAGIEGNILLDAAWEYATKMFGTARGVEQFMVRLMMVMSATGACDTEPMTELAVRLKVFFGHTDFDGAWRVS